MGTSNSNGLRLLDFCSNNQLLVTKTWFRHKSVHKATSDCSRPGHIIDSVLINQRFHTSVLDSQVYCSVLHESDHELVVSTLWFKIKVKHHLPLAPHHQTTNLPADIKMAFQSSLIDALNRSDPAATIESSWSAYNSDWVTDELRNLSKKKGNAWLRYCNAAKQGHDVSRHREEYKHYCKLSRVAAEKASNFWWSSGAVDAERHAWTQLGCGGFELRLLRNHFFKPSSSTLTASDGSLLTTDYRLIQAAEVG